MRYLLAVLLLVAALWIVPAHATTTCVPISDTSASCVKKSDAQAFIHALPAQSGSCAQYGGGATWRSPYDIDQPNDQPGTGTLIRHQLCSNSAPVWGIDLGFASYTVDDLCGSKTGQTFSVQFYQAVQSNLPSSGWAACGADNCEVIYNSDVAPTWVLSQQKWTQGGYETYNGHSCSTGESPGQSDNPTPPTDTDKDGVPDAVDPYPTDPGDTPPPPPPDTPPDGSPTGSSPATGADIGTMTNILAIKLDALLASSEAGNIKIDQGAAMITAAVTAASGANASAIVAAIQAIPVGSSSGGSTDMGPTNALLGTGNGLLGDIKANTAHGTQSGGTSCSFAPVLTGNDEHAMYMELEAWKTQCEGAHSVGGGSDCTTPYTCTGGDPVLCESLKQQHDTKCTVDLLAADMKGSGASDEGSPIDPSAIWSSSSSDVPGAFDTAGLGYGSSVPTLPQIHIAGHGYDIPYQDKFSAIIAAIRLLVLGLALILCIQILSD